MVGFATIVNMFWFLTVRGETKTLKLTLLSCHGQFFSVLNSKPNFKLWVRYWWEKKQSHLLILLRYEKFGDLVPQHVKEIHWLRKMRTVKCELWSCTHCKWPNPWPPQVWPTVAMVMLDKWGQEDCQGSFMSKPVKTPGCCGEKMSSSSTTRPP